MPLPSSGKITTQTFRDFFEIDANTPISSSDWYRGGPYVRANYQSENGRKSINNQVPESGRISLSDLYGVYKVVDTNSLSPGNSTTQDVVNQPPSSPDTGDPGHVGNNDAATEDPFANPSNQNPPSNQDGNAGNPTPPNPSDPYQPGNPADPGQFGNSDTNPGSGDSDPNPNPPNNPSGNYGSGYFNADPQPGNWNGSNNNTSDFGPTPPNYPDAPDEPAQLGGDGNDTNSPGDVTGGNPPYWFGHERLV